MFITPEKEPSTVYVNFTDFIKSKELDILPTGHRQIEGMVYLKNTLGLKYFSPAPVGVLFGKTYACVSVASESFDGIIENLTQAIENGQEVILYDLIYIPALPQFTELNPETFEPIPLETPTMSPSGWKVRYGMVDKND